MAEQPPGVYVLQMQSFALAGGAQGLTVQAW